MAAERQYWHGVGICVLTRAFWDVIAHDLFMWRIACLWNCNRAGLDRANQRPPEEATVQN
jgi:hypothetical protein